MMNNILVTAANSLYFDTLLTLISSIHKHSFDLVDLVVVYNLGLSDDEIKKLNSIKKVKTKDFSTLNPLPYTDFLFPKWHGYKPFCLYNEKNNSKNILWLDAGAMLLKPIDEIYKIIENDGIFLVGDVHLNVTYTKNKCVEIMKATNEELNDTQLWSGMLGYKSNGPFQNIIDEAFNYSLIPNCVIGDEENHRHDQSVYSILASRYKCKKHNIDIYGYWTDINRNLKTATELGAVIFAHRRGHNDIKDIRYEI